MSPASLNGLLKNVSRSFYLTLRVLPRSVRPQIGVAYLLARASDTIADSGMLQLSDRLAEMRKLREHIAGGLTTPIDFEEVTITPSDIGDGERALLERIESVFAVFHGFGPADQRRIREVLQVIISGQESDLTRFDATGDGLKALATAEELDDYTYRVAGCVGEFWTHMCRAHVFPNAPLDDPSLLENGVRFGKGLQLVNILRDIPRDLRNGRCYLPQQELAKAGLRPDDLMIPTQEPFLRPVYNRWLTQAEAHLKAGWEYTNALPRNCMRVRLACAWPILIGMRTIERLKVEPVLDPDRRIKVTRAEVRNIMGRSLLLYAFPSAWRNQVPARPS